MVADGALDEILQQLLVQIKANNTEAGLIIAISACGKLLAEQVPSTHDQGELPNHWVIYRELADTWIFDGLQVKQTEQYWYGGLDFV